MGADPLTLALIAGGLSAVQSLSSTSAANKQARYQQDVAEANAEAARNQAKITAEKGRIEGENLDRERSALRRQYADLQSGNIASLGALGVDMSSGSAVDTLEGNTLRFSQDVALNRYQKALSEWETGENVKAQETTAANYDATASYYGSTVKGLGDSLLTSGLSGLTSGIGVYSIAGGFGGNSNQLAGNTFAKSGANKVMHANQYVKLGH